jgi:hypothetical protein
MSNSTAETCPADHGGKTLPCLAALAIALALPGTVQADTGSLTFVNTAERPLSVSFVDANQCVIDPVKSNRPLGPDSHTTYPLTVDTACGDAQIRYRLSTMTGNSKNFFVGGVVTYRRYKGQNGKWLAKMSFTPDRETPFNYLRVTCGAKKVFCKGIGTASSDVQASVAVLSLALEVDTILTNPRMSGKSR